MANPPYSFNDGTKGEIAVERLLLNQQDMYSHRDNLTLACTEWLVNSWTPNAIATNQFVLAEGDGNVSAYFLPGQKVKLHLDGGWVYGTVLSTSFTTILTITLLEDILDVTLDEIQLGILTPGASSSRPNDIVTTDTVQTISGVKVFSSLPSLSADPSSSIEAVRKGYVDAQITAVNASIEANKAPIRFAKNGLMSIQNGMAYIPASVAATISAVRVAVVVAPSGGVFSIKLKKNGSSDIFAATTLNIGSGSYSGETTNLQNNTLIYSDYLRLDVTAANGAENIMLTIYL